MDLLARLRSEFNVDIPAGRIFETSSAAGLAAFIDEYSIRPPSPDSRFIVPIQRGAPGVRPLFLVAGGWGGEIEFLVYGQLGRHIGEHQPIFGLKARGAGTAESPHTSTTEMAADYLREIRAIQPHGPYLIAGECVGGVCAHEIACQLREAGEQVALLMLLDTSTPTQEELAEYLRQEEAKRATEVKPPSLYTTIRGKVGELARTVLGRETPPPAPAPHPRGQERYPVTLMSHALRPYTGRITLLVDAEAHELYGNLGWQKIEGVELDVHVLPGTHITYIRDNNVSAAAKLREILDRANGGRF
jgi:thioesterase domain-containing protein